MEYTPHELLAGWDSFYVIIGSAAAALTGLQFVVMALVADSPQSITPEGIAAFGTPTVVHFCVAFLASALLTAPWHNLGSMAIPVMGAGVAGLIYSVLVMRRAGRQSQYQPVAEDWVWHVVLPLVAYTGMTGAGIGLFLAPIGALFTLGGMTLLLVFIGIHNAWDTIAYMTLQRRETPPQ